MAALTISLGNAERFLFRRRFGDPAWDVIVRASGALALIAIPVTLYEPHTAALTGFVLVTMWINGPFSPVLPATYEPVLMLVGRVYPPVAVAALGTAAILAMEYVNYRLYRRLLFVSKLRPVREQKVARHILGLFWRAPFFTIWLCSWSPLPYWIVRFLSPLAVYPVERHLLATMLGRFPRLWFFAALGAFWQVDAWVLFAVSAASILWGWRSGPGDCGNRRGRREVVSPLWSPKSGASNPGLESPGTPLSLGETNRLPGG